MLASLLWPFSFIVDYRVLCLQTSQIITTPPLLRATVTIAMTSNLAHKRQTRLNITPVISSSSSPSSLPSSTLPTTRAKRKRYQKRQTTLEFPPNIEMPTPVSVKDGAGSKTKPEDPDESSSSDDDIVVPSGPHSTPFKRLQHRRTVYVVESEDENSAEDEKPQSVGEPESTGDERMQSSPTKRRGAKRKQTIVPEDDFIVPDSDVEEEDEEPIRRSPKKRIKANSETPASSDDEPVQVSLQSSSKSKFRRSAILEVSDDDEDIEDPEEESTRKPRRATALESTKIGSPNSGINEDEELKKELEDLQELEMSSQKSPTKNARDARKASLARLRKARSAGVSPQLTRRQKVVLSDSEHEEEEVEGYDEAYGSTYRDHQLETEVDREFIAEDEPNAEIGVPDIPLQFSKFATAKASKLFRYVVEWMLQKRLNPKFEEKELYLFAFKRVGDEITGLVHSYMSTVWTPEFTYTLLARPEYSEVEIGDAERILYPSCEACNRTNHPASWAIQFSKNAYDAKSLEEVERKNRDNHGRAIASESKVFHLGRECATNARNAHPLVHWSYILYDHINEQWDARHRLKIDGHWSTAKKTRKIARFVDKMQDEGQIKKLFMDFRNDIDVARQMKVEDW